jgi:hypothetical protein
MPTEIKCNVWKEGPRSVDLKVGMKLFESAVSALEKNTVFMGIVGTLPIEISEPIEFKEGDWTYRVRMPISDWSFGQERWLAISRKQDFFVEGIEIVENYRNLNDPKPVRVDCEYTSIYSRYHPNTIKTFGGAVEIVDRFIQEINPISTQSS